MSATSALLELAGQVALLLWGVHMVQSGVQRACGPALRRFLAGALSARPRAFAAGLGVTALLQSSTAVGLMATAFAAEGLVELVPALAAMLGANVGTTLIVQVLSFDVSQLAPVLVLVGVVLFRRGRVSRTRDLGRAAIGLGLMLLSLRLLVEQVTPYGDAPGLRLVLDGLAGQPVLEVLLAALVTWAAHSSVAVVLVVMELAGRGVVPPEAAFVMVLGANLGTAVNPLLEGVPGSDPSARRLPFGNLLTRVVGAVVVLALVRPAGHLVLALAPDPARAVADFHTAFNLAVAVVMLPLLTPYAALLRRLLPARVTAADPSRPLYLDAASRESPPLALAAASREALRMADALEAMLAGAQAALTEGDRSRISAARHLDDVLDRLNGAIKSYLAAIDFESLTESDDQRLSQILVFALNLEHAGDVVERNVLGLAARLQKRGFAFSGTECVRVRDWLQRLQTNLRAACGVFMTGDPRAARLLLAEKETFRAAEAEATAAHIARLRAGGAQEGAGTAQLDLLRDLKQVNAHLVAAAAHPVLEAKGDLLPSRLRPEE